MPVASVIFYAALGVLGLFAALAVRDLMALLARAVSPKRLFGAARAGKWPAVRRHHLALHPSCAACGSTERIEAHHIDPFHLHPDKELDAGNLISLCEKHGCHLAFGHSYDWHAFNPHVREDVRIQLMRTKQRAYE
jgi:5-methylcytosine-specific restriction protein A